jgi:hypothetical protein
MNELANIKKFVMAGNAIFTLLSVATGTRFTFRVKAKKDGGIPHFVSVFNGTDNENDYAFLGTIFPDGNYKPSMKSIFKDDSKPQEVFKWFFTRIETLPITVQIFHEGKCGRCGRTLTVPESIQSGFGPECIGKI